MSGYDPLPGPKTAYAPLPGGQSHMSSDCLTGRPTTSDVWKRFWPIGILSFGGTQANMAMFNTMLVKDSGWVGQDAYGELLGIVQTLPGASAAQIVLAAVTAATGRPSAGILAFLLFCIPGAIGMAVLGTSLTGVDILKIQQVAAAQTGIGCAATVLVATGAWQLGSKLVTDKLTKTLWLAACISCYGATSNPLALSILIVVGLLLSALVSLWYYPDDGKKAGVSEHGSVGIGRTMGCILMTVAWLPLPIVTVAPFFPGCPQWLNLAGIFYKVGVLVFGGGPVVIPLLLLQLVAIEALTSHQFLVGFAAVQAFPGPMFNLAAFCGGLMAGWPGAVIAWAAMMIPGMLMALGALPFWADMRRSPRIQRMLKGVNAFAAGLMGSAVLLLWETLVSPKPVRVCLTVALIGLSEIASVKPYWLILLGIVIGLGGWYVSYPL